MAVSPTQQTVAEQFSQQLEENADLIYTEFAQYAMLHPHELGEVSLSFFCSQYLEEHFSSGFGQFQYPVMKYLEDLKPGFHTLLLFPREHGKSTLFTLAYILWCICYRKKLHIILVSCVRETAEKFLANVKQELMTNQKIIRDFGDLIGDHRKSGRVNRVGRVRTTNHVVVTTTSTLGPVRGTVESIPLNLHETVTDAEGNVTFKPASVRPDLILGDDLVDDKKTMNKDVRDKVWNWFWMNLYSAQQMGQGNVLIVGTTVHEDDLVCRLDKDTNQTRRWYKATLPAANPDKPFDENGDPIDCLFPEKWGQKDMNAPIPEIDPATGKERIVYKSYLWWRAQELGPAFGPEFLMRPVDEKTRFFRREQLGWYVPNAPHIDPTLAETAFHSTGKVLEYLPDDLICVTTIDPAGTDESRMKQATTDPDYTVVCTTGYSPTTKKFYLVAVNRMRCSPGDTIQSALMHMMMFDKKHGGRYYPDQKNRDHYYAGFKFFHIGVGVETVAFQKVLSVMFEEMAVALGMYPMVWEMARGARMGKRIRAMLPAQMCQMGNLMFPYPVPGRADQTVEDCINELVSFPMSDSHDDFVDAFTDGIHILHTFSLQLQRGLNSIEAVRHLASGAYDFKPGEYGTMSQEEIIQNLQAPSRPVLTPATPA